MPDDFVECRPALQGPWWPRLVLLFTSHKAARKDFESEPFEEVAEKAIGFRAGYKPSTEEGLCI
jgi:hypothetical protein